MKIRHWLIALMALGVGTACTEAPQQEMEQAPAEQVAEPMGTNGEGAAVMESDGDVAESNVVYVDVRTPEEYAAGHVEGAILIPHTEMAQRYTELEQYRDREIVVYCRSGRRSGIAKGILEDEGFDNVTNGGGFSELQAEGVPTVR